MFCLVQASKRYEGNYGDIELDRSCPKDSDAILDLGDYAFGMWGHWFSATGEPVKHIYGKFFKSRGYDEEVFGDNPYFYLDIDKPKMLVKDIRHAKTFPEFQTGEGREFRTYAFTYTKRPSEALPKGQGWSTNGLIPVVSQRTVLRPR